MTSSHDIKKLVTVNVNSALQDYMLFNEMTATYIQLLLQFKPLTELMPGLYMCTLHMNKTTSVTFFTYVIRYEHLTEVYLPIVTYGSLSVLP